METEQGDFWKKIGGNENRWDLIIVFYFLYLNTEISWILWHEMRLINRHELQRWGPLIGSG